jgi:hypothetical protein
MPVTSNLIGWDVAVAGAAPSRHAEEAEARGEASPSASASVEGRHDPRAEGLYIGGFLGYSHPHGLNNIQGTGLASFATSSSLELDDSLIYGGKLGYYFQRPGWFGLELEAFHSRPHLPPQSATFSAFGFSFTVPGLSVTDTKIYITTIAVNAMVRGRFLCEPSDGADKLGRCSLQPYVGIGPGAFVTRATNALGSSTAVAPGLNALAGVRYFVTHHAALFGEYKYNYAPLRLDNIESSGAGVEGNYSASHFIAGFSWHF